MKSLAFWVMALVVLGCIGMIYEQGYSNKKFDFGNIDLTFGEYDELNEAFEDHVGYKVCDLRKGECQGFINFDKYKKVVEAPN